MNAVHLRGARSTQRIASVSTSTQPLSGEDDLGPFVVDVTKNYTKLTLADMVLPAK